MMSKETLENLFVKDKYSFEGISGIIRTQKEMEKDMSEPFAIDPRNNTITIFCPTRMKRPNNYSNVSSNDENGECPICQGKTTPIIAYRELKDGSYAFVNENLFPILNPDGTRESTNLQQGIYGIHLLVWPTTQHKDIHELSPEAHAVCFELMADLESRLQATADRNVFPAGHFQVIKNTGKAVGGSLSHGHYQVGFMNKLPRKIEDDKRFLEEQGESFAQYLLRENTGQLQIKDYDSVVSITPSFMRRPLDAIICPKDTNVQLLGELNGSQYFDFARATSEAASALSVLMPKMGREFAYNLVFHTGPIGTMYIEVLPYTQEEGGFEKAGLNVCQNSPEISTRLYREAIN